MRNLLVRISFVGTRYSGFQVQNNAPTVCGELNRALLAVLKHPAQIKGVSRTDAGVHAKDFAFSVKTDNPIPEEGLVHALTALLPKDIGVKSCIEVPETFHARYSCTGKEYAYRFLPDFHRDPFTEPFVYRCGMLNAEAMDAAAARFVGRHDFSAFRAAGSDTVGSVRTVFSSCVRRESGLVAFRVAGDGFLYNMVRIMAGTLLEIGMGRRQADSIDTALKKGERTLAGPTAPAKGLCLEQCFYEGTGG